MDINKLVTKLKEAARKLENDNSTYEIREELMPGRGTGNYKFVFVAKKKGGFGLLKDLKSVANIAKGALYGGIEGALWRASWEVEKRQYRSTLEPIEKKAKGSELAPVLKRWAETIPKGFIETIGSDLVIPDDPSWISAEIKPGKVIKITMDFAKLRSDVEAEAAKEEYEKVEEEVTETVKQVAETYKKVAESFIPVIPEAMKAMMPTVVNQLYVNGSLKNVENGFKLELYNGFTDVGIVSPIKVKVDGVDIDPEKITIVVGSDRRKSMEIDLSNPLVFKQNSKGEIIVEGVNLPAGPHRIDIETNIQGYGSINIVVMDKI